MLELVVVRQWRCWVWLHALPTRTGAQGQVPKYLLVLIHGLRRSRLPLLVCQQHRHSHVPPAECSVGLCSLCQVLSATDEASSGLTCSADHAQDGPQADVSMHHVPHGECRPVHLHYGVFLEGGRMCTLPLLQGCCTAEAAPLVCVGQCYKPEGLSCTRKGFSWVSCRGEVVNGTLLAAGALTPINNSTCSRCCHGALRRDCGRHAS
jgi:hypothetical protein